MGSMELKAYAVRNATGTGTRIERQAYHKTIEKAWTSLRAFYRSGETDVDRTPIDLSDELMDKGQPNGFLPPNCEYLPVSHDTQGPAEHI